MEKLGVCGDLTVLRFVLDGIPPCRDSKLLIKDLKVDGVPLRIYQPKWPPTGKRRGILYFHGGAGTFGSISKKSASSISKIKSKPLPFRYVSVLSLVLLLSYFKNSRIKMKHAYALIHEH